ncbi:AraC family transcriptional regulator [Streptomyces sp. NPDC048290]|uniref:AraC family transcriptional regulator n=1 Tax=Streptomyces sp. NPDC048290 TaxID=3155811 RepID=UPI003439B52B
MDEFASARLVALVQRSLAGEGIQVAAPTAAGALLPFEAKRRFLRAVARDHGLLPLLRAGSLMAASPADPAVSALLGAAGPGDLFGRWQRLEAFTHSRHRVVMRECGAGHAVVEHVGPRGRPPEPAEDAVVLGVLTALLALTGARDLTVGAGYGEVSTVFAAGAVRAAPPRHGGGLWRFTWSGTAPPVPSNPARTGTDVVARTRVLLGADLARRWTLPVLAAELGLPVRSLQRRLTEVGGFSHLLGELRAEAAAALLLDDAHSIGVIGFACGYADQPHFTRHFRLRTAMTPAAYRSAFRRSDAHQSGATARTARPHGAARSRTA